MPDPMYKLIADDLRRQIESGTLQTGDQLPTGLQLQAAYASREEFSDRVSRNTIRDAVSILVAAGLVENRSGLGTFVTKVEPFVTTLSGDPERGDTQLWESEVSRFGYMPRLTVPRIEINGAHEVPSLAPELQLDEDKQALSRHQRCRIDRTPYSMQTSFYPMDFAAKAPQLLTAEDITEGVVAYIRKTLGIRQAGWSDEIRIRPPTDEEARFFNLPFGRTGVQIIEVRRTAFNEDGRPIRLTVTSYRADRNRLAYHMGKGPPQSL